MKHIRGALLSAVALSLAVTPTLAAASGASSLSLGRASTGSSRASKAVPTVPSWLAIALVGGLIAGAAVVATDSPDSA
jgi:hypothetical protein